jgi:hypothetical protein
MYPGATPILSTEEIRMLPENDDEMASAAKTSHLQTGLRGRYDHKE